MIRESDVGMDDIEDMRRMMDSEELVGINLSHCRAGDTNIRGN